MVSRRRYVEAGYIYHVLNRGTQRQQLFAGDDDYLQFETLIAETIERTPLSIHTYQLMPNHWHFVVRPLDKDELSCFFQYLAGTHGKRFRAARRTTGEGHVYQDRFKSFPIQDDDHFLTVCRYVERNAVRAQFVTRAEDWKWGGLWRREQHRGDWLTSEWPVARPENWRELVNEPLTAAELRDVRRSVRRGSPFGTPSWIRGTADQLDLRHTLRSAGRPSVIASWR